MSSSSSAWAVERISPGQEFQVIHSSLTSILFLMVVVMEGNSIGFIGGGVCPMSRTLPKSWLGPYLAPKMVPNIVVERNHYHTKPNVRLVRITYHISTVQSIECQGLSLTTYTKRVTSTFEFLTSTTGRFADQIHLLVGPQTRTTCCLTTSFPVSATWKEMDSTTHGVTYVCAFALGC